MAWIVAGVLALIVLTTWSLYKRAMAETRGLASLLSMVLLDETVRDSQRKGLVEFIKAAPAANAGELGLKVNMSLANLGQRLDPSILLGAPGFLWKVKQDGDAVEIRNPLFTVHYVESDSEQIRMPASELEQWALAEHEGGFKIETICDGQGYVIWPEKTGERIFTN